MKFENNNSLNQIINSETDNDFCDLLQPIPEKEISKSKDIRNNLDDDFNELFKDIDIENYEIIDLEIGNNFDDVLKIGLNEKEIKKEIKKELKKESGKKLKKRIKKIITENSKEEIKNKIINDKNKIPKFTQNFNKIGENPIEKQIREKLEIKKEIDYDLFFENFEKEIKNKNIKNENKIPKFTQNFNKIGENPIEKQIREKLEIKKEIDYDLFFENFEKKIKNKITNNKNEIPKFTQNSDKIEKELKKLKKQIGKRLEIKKEIIDFKKILFKNSKKTNNKNDKNNGNNKNDKNDDDKKRKELKNELCEISLEINRLKNILEKDIDFIEKKIKKENVSGKRTKKEKILVLNEKKIKGENVSEKQTKNEKILVLNEKKIKGEKKKIYVKQGRVSNSISYFQPMFLRTYKLTRYTNISKPCVFFGCYDDYDLAAISNHKNLKIIVWAGSDSDYKKRFSARKSFLFMKRMRNIHHIAISKYIYDDLRENNIPAKQIAFCINNIHNFTPCRKGASIYFYTSISNCETYGCSIFNEVYNKLKFKYNFIIAVCKKQLSNKKGNVLLKYPFLRKAKYYNNISNIYKKCFVGLRLTKHDGNANTVQELGMCGIRCFFNGDDKLANTIPWKNSCDIINKIENEAKQIGEIDFEMSNKVKDYLKPNFNWLNIENYLYK